MHMAFVAVHQNEISVQRLCCDVFCVDHQRDRQRPGHNRRMRAY